MKKIITIIVIVSFATGLATLGYFHFNLKFQEFLKSDSSAASVANTFMSYNKGEEDGFSFIVVSDTETNEGNLSSTFRNIINSANSGQAKFLVHLGDFTGRGKDAEFKEVKDYLDENLNIPCYAAPGNHDIIQDKETKDIFKKYFNNLYYSFDYENSHFIILDNSNNKYGFGAEQLLWLENDLKENLEKQIFIFMHRPINVPYADKVDISDGASKKAKEGYSKFAELIREYQVAKIFAGHVHIYFSYSLEGTPVIITGGGGSEPNLSFLESLSSFSHYIDVKVRSNSHTSKIVEIE